MKTTYLFGAGASYYAVPIVNQLQKAMHHVNSYLNQDIPLTVSQRSKDLLSESLRSVANNANIFGTVDTYAKKLSLTDSAELRKLKAALSVFFTVWQEIGYGEYKNIRPDPFTEIDQRYLSLLANYLELDNRKIKLNDDVSFITWNYDSQIERALALFTNEELSTVLARFSVFPFKTAVGVLPKIVHLNGIAGLYRDRGDTSKVSTIFPETALEKTKQDRNIFFEYMQGASEGHIRHGDLFSFAWEDDETSRNSLEYAKKILAETEILVIIGYSFPTFNDPIDKALMSEVSGNNRLRRVYYQDPNATADILTARFGFFHDKIKVVQNVDQFILPLDAASFGDQPGYLVGPEAI